MLELIFSIIIVLCPIAVWIFSLVFYLSAKIKSQKIPNAYTKQQVNNRLIFLIVTSVVLFLFAVVLVGFIALLYGALTYM